MTINHRLLADAQDYYVGLGYKYIEVPWIAPLDIIKRTLPADAEPHVLRHPESVEGMALVGSGEQSFCG